VSDREAETGQSRIGRWGVETGGSRFARLVAGGDLTTRGIMEAIGLAMMWGAAHALSPGHGKTLVSAYLVGSRGTPKHAAFLGLTVTITHTTGVLALGLVTLFASRFVVPQDLLPWLGAGSGALVVLIGLSTLWQRLPRRHRHYDHTHDSHDHHHEGSHQRGIITHTHGGASHSHLPPGNEGSPLAWRGLLALGVSGGLVPCPSALVVLLGAVALGRAGFGLALVVAFSVGLAATLTLLGIASLYASHFIRRRMPAAGRIGTSFRYAPAAGSVVLTLAGFAIIARALGELGMR
jgi:ABC-type nickel/cobalt efflux system permease component RcnA